MGKSERHRNTRRSSRVGHVAADLSCHEAAATQDYVKLFKAHAIWIGSNPRKQLLMLYHDAISSHSWCKALISHMVSLLNRQQLADPPHHKVVLRGRAHRNTQHSRQLRIATIVGNQHPVRIQQVAEDRLCAVLRLD